MAVIAHDASTDGGTATGTSLTFAHTCTGTDRILFVAVSTDTADNVDYVTGVTYGAVAMAQVNTFRSPGSGGHELYMLVNPASGANNVVITTSSSVAIYGAASSYTGARQAGQPDASDGNAADPATSLTVSVNTVRDNCWLVSSAGKKAGSAAVLSAGTNTTARKVNNFVAIGDSNAAQTPPGSFSQRWNTDASTGIAVIVASISPAIEESVDDYARFI